MITWLDLLLDGLSAFRDTIQLCRRCAELSPCSQPVASFLERLNDKRNLDDRSQLISEVATEESHVDCSTEQSVESCHGEESLSETSAGVPSTDLRYWNVNDLLHSHAAGSLSWMNGLQHFH